MRIAVFATNESINEYSGGRYASLIMAEALAVAGHDTYYITNNKPLFYRDLSLLPGDERLSLVLTDDFVSDLPTEKFDVVILVPQRSKDTSFFDNTRAFAKKRSAKLVLLNFETPNWFNEFSPVKRDESFWDSWKDCCEDGCLVLSLSMEGERFAREFYINHPEKTEFDFCYPSINTAAADSVPASPAEKRIVIITRFKQKHKGARDIINLLSPAMRGYTLVFLIGKGDVGADIQNEISAATEQAGIYTEYLYRISDVEKFRELKRSSLMLFPSYFEGYGYPPVEAQYCKIPCIAYDLPVLREINGTGIHYVPRGDTGAFREKIIEVLREAHSRQRKTNLRITDIASFERYTKRLEDVLQRYMSRERETALSQ